MQGTSCEQSIPVVAGQYFVLVGVRRQLAAGSVTLVRKFSNQAD